MKGLLGTIVAALLAALAPLGPALPAEYPPTGRPERPAEPVLRSGSPRFQGLVQANFVYFVNRGRWLVGGWSDGVGAEIVVWDAESGRDVTRLSLPNKGIESLTVSPDGRRVAIFGSEPGVERNTRVWEWTTTPPGRPGAPQVWRELVGLSRAIGSASRVAFSPDGRTLAAALVMRPGGGKLPFVELSLWDIVSAKQRDGFRVALTGSDRAFLFSPDGRTLAVCGQTVQLWDVTTGRRSRDLKGPTLVASGCFSQDSKRFVSGHADDTAWLWDLETGKKQRAIDAPVVAGRRHGVTGVTYVALSPDGKTIGSGGLDGTFRLWRSDTGEEVRKIVVAPSPGKSLFAWSPDRKQVVAGWPARLFDVTTGAEERTDAQARGRAFFSPDGKVIATAPGHQSGAGNDGIQVWDATTGKWLRRLQDSHTFRSQFTLGMGLFPEVCSVAFSPDSNLLAAGMTDGTIRSWNVGTGREVFHVQAERATVWSVAFSRDGRTILSSGPGPFVTVWEAKTGKLLREPAFQPRRLPSAGWAECTLSGDARFFLAAARNNRSQGHDALTVWDVTSGKRIAELEPLKERDYSHFCGCVFSAGGKYLAAAWDDEVRVYEVATSRKVSQFSIGGSINAAPSIAFSPDAKRLATVTSEGKKVVIWDIASGEALQSFAGHKGRIVNAAFSPDGKRLVTGSLDGTALVWDLSALPKPPAKQP